jgi:polar amino acid transport system substrate-binding protein
MKNSFIIVIIAFILLTFSAGAAEKIIFVTTEYPPLEFMKDGQPAGLQVDIIKQVCKRLGIVPEIQLVPWKRALMYVKEGKADAIFAARHTEERTEFLHYPSEPMGVEKAVIIARKGSGISINTLDDLKGKTVYVVRSYKYEPKFDNHPDIKKEICDDDTDLVNRLAKGHFSLAAGADEIAMKYFCRQAGFRAETVYILKESPVYVAFSKKTATGKSLAEKFGEALRAVKKEGFTRKIEKQYQ